MYHFIKYLLFTLFLCFAIPFFAQTVRVFEIKSNGAKGNLIRTELYANGQVILQKNYTSENQLDYEITKTYDPQGNLKKEVKTFKKGHEYDLIREYDYDNKNQKTFVLFGNNRTGKWGSNRFTYNTQGVLDSVFIFQKNGDLTQIGVYDYSYDAQGRKLTEKRYNIDLELEEKTLKNSSIYQYQGNTTISIEKDEVGQLIARKTLTTTTFGLPKMILFESPELGSLKTIHTYNSKQQLTTTKEYMDEQLLSTTTYRYNSKGKCTQKKHKYANGQFGGEIYR